MNKNKNKSINQRVHLTIEQQSKLIEESKLNNNNLNPLSNYLKYIIFRSVRHRRE